MLFLAGFYEVTGGFGQYARRLEASQKKQNRGDIMGINGKIIRLADLLDHNQSYPAKKKRREMLEGIRWRTAYIVRSTYGQALYIGASSLGARDRLYQHIRMKSRIGQAIIDNRSTSDNWMIEIIPYPSRKLMLQAELELIKCLNPLFNIVGKVHDIGDFP